MDDLDSVRAGGRKEREPDIGSLTDVYKFPEGKWVTLRLLPGVVSNAGYWVSTKKKDGGKTKFRTNCPSYDPATQERDSTKYDPWRDLQAKESQAVKDGDLDVKATHVQYEQKYFMNAIIRALVKDEPARKPKHTANERKAGFKEKDSDSWTPIKVVRLGRSLVNKIKDLKGLNIVEGSKGAKAFPVTDAKYGRDIRVMFDSSKAPAEQYQVQLGDKRSPLTEEELEYLKWDIETANTQKEMSEDEVRADFTSWATRNNVKVAMNKKGKGRTEEDEDEDFDDEDEDEAPKKKKAPAKKTAVKSKKFKDEDEDDENFDDEDEEDEEEAPKKSKKPAPKKAAPKSKKSRDEDEEDEEDEDEDFDDEDEEDEDEDFDDEDEEDEDKAPRKKSKKPVKKAPAKKRRPSDDEEEDDEDEEEDDEPPKKSKKTPVKKVTSKSKSDDEDEEDDFDDEDEEDEDEAPRKKSASKSKKAPAKKSKSDDDDEDDFDDEDEEEDEEDDEPPKKSTKKPVKKAPAKKSSKRSKDEDDEDDFDDEDD